MVLSPISILGGDSVYCINEAQMEHAKKLTEEDPESSKKIKSIIDKLEKKINKFVLSSNQALIWDTLERIGSNQTVEGLGSLFKSH